MENKGLLGLEAAKVCVDLGLETTVLERNPRILARQIDSEGANLLQEDLLKLKLRCSVSASTKRINADTQTGVVSKIVYLDATGAEKVEDVDLVVIATGIAARDEIAREAGLVCEDRGGVIVNDDMRTSDPAIFAVGEVAAHEHKIYGLGVCNFHSFLCPLSNLPHFL